MSTPIGEERYSSQHTGNKRVADPNLQLAPCSADPMEKHRAIIAIPGPPGDSVPRASAVLANQQPLPSFDVAHHGWDASNVSTAKCDLCHKQRCGTLQKCRVCKLSICQECCVAGRLQNDRRHAIDATAVSWDVPPNTRKRKNRAQGNSHDPPTTVKRQRVANGTKRGGHEQWAAGDSTETSVSSTADNSPAARYTPVPETETKEQISGIEYDHGSPLEPQLSVLPASHYSSASYAQYADAVSSKHPAQDGRGTVSPGQRTLPLIEEESGDSHGRNWLPLDTRPYPVASNPNLISGYPVSAASRPSQDSASRPVLPPISFLAPEKHWHRHHHHHHQQQQQQQQQQPIEVLSTSLDFVGRLEDLLHHHRQPVTSEMWPHPDFVSSLGVRLADAARMKQMSSSPSMPLDRCLRDEIQNEWNSHSFVATDRDAGRRYRHILAAAYFASTCLGLSPQLNAAREWLREKEGDLREMGYELTKSMPLMNFLQEIGVWYLRQVQR